jgi:hypothetical protein
MTRGRLPILSPKDAIDTTTLPISEGLFLYSYLTLDKGRMMLKVLVARQKSLSFHNKITITQQTTPTIAIGLSFGILRNVLINGAIFTAAGRRTRKLNCSHLLCDIGEF